MPASLPILIMRGGRLTDMDEDDTELHTIIKQSDALLGLIDGKKIYSLMSNSNRSDIDSFVNKDLPSIIKWMSDCQVPVHFVLSKWDLLEKSFALKEISDRLLKIPKFQQIVHERNQVNSPIRLIPVSSVGSGFATLEADGSMKKKSGAIPKPYQVEVPISCVFPDDMRVRITQLSQKRQELENQKIGQKNVLFQFAQTASSYVVDIFLEQLLVQYLPPDLILVKPFLNKLDDVLFSQIRIRNQDNLNRLKAERDVSLAMVKDEATALEHAIDSFLYVQEKLELDFPESQLFSNN